jgi:peptide methionine sulfoxide reductase msrA/msrB
MNWKSALPRLTGLWLLLMLIPGGCTKTMSTAEFNELTPAERRVIEDKGTEPPFSGEYWNHRAAGTYHCRRCDAALYRSETKFDSGCGWPSFDDAVPSAVREAPDADGSRTEILCAACGAHLGHVFRGERFTPRDTRHCVNSLSMRFKAAAAETAGRAVFASGCFWGPQYLFDRLPGVVSTRVGYTGGKVDNPSYEQVCTGRTGHAEAFEVLFDPETVSYERLVKFFFETHDFTQANGQGPDIGPQYRSAVFPVDAAQETTVRRVIARLEQLGQRKVVTTIEPAARFWPAEDYHQQYYKQRGKTPSCHRHRNIFPE